MKKIFLFLVLSALTTSISAQVYRSYVMTSDQRVEFCTIEVVGQGEIEISFDRPLKKLPEVSAEFLRKPLTLLYVAKQQKYVLATAKIVDDEVEYTTSDGEVTTLPYVASFKNYMMRYAEEEGLFALSEGRIIY